MYLCVCVCVCVYVCMYVCTSLCVYVYTSTCSAKGVNDVLGALALFFFASYVSSLLTPVLEFFLAVSFLPIVRATFLENLTELLLLASMFSKCFLCTQVNVLPFHTIYFLLFCLETHGCHQSKKIDHPVDGIFDVWEKHKEKAPGPLFCCPMAIPFCV